jgi:hypothetical protein
MKKKIIYSVLSLLMIGITVSSSLSLNKSNNINLKQLINISMASSSEGGGNVKDEKDVCMKQECSGGKTCECTGCERGTTDCTPTCPCCD